MVSLKWPCVVDLLVLLAGLTICTSLMVATATPPPSPHTESTVNDPKLHTGVDAVHLNGGGHGGYGCHDYYPEPPPVIGNPWPPTPCRCEPIYCGNPGGCHGFTMHFNYPIQATGASKISVMDDAAAAMAPKSA